jgi:Hydantoinase/oxoprolinase
MWTRAHGMQHARIVRWHSHWLPAPGCHATMWVQLCGACERLWWLLCAGVTIQAPQLDINTVAAGGGSRLFFRRGLFQVISRALRHSIHSGTPAIKSWRMALC